MTFCFLLNTGLSALNFGLYVKDGNWPSLVAGVFCGAVALFFLIMLVVRRNEGTA